jgi:hypothetical protein
MRAKKIDSNQPRIVEQLRDLYVSVQILSGVGDDCPDLLLGFRGNNFLIELKDPSRKPCERKLRPGQQKFFDSWRGQVNKCETLEEILIVIGHKVVPDSGPHFFDSVTVDRTEPNY